MGEVTFWQWCIEHSSTFIASILGTLASGGTYILFYKASKKKKELENDAEQVKINQDTIKMWRDLYDQARQEVQENKEEIKKLKDENDDLRKMIGELKDNMVKLGIKVDRAEAWTCKIKGCERRDPPNDM